MEQEVIRNVSNAIREGKIVDLESLIEKHSIPVAGEPQFFSTPFLNSAIHANQFEIVKWLLEKGVSPTETRYGHSNLNPPLYLALYNGHLEIAKLLINYGCKFDDIEKPNYIFVQAVCRHDTDMFHYLLELGMDVKKIEEEHTLIESAISSEHNTKENIAFIELLVKHGADVNNRPRIFDDGALIKTIRINRTDLFEYLLSLGADPNNIRKRTGSILFEMLAYQNPKKADIKRMLEMGVDIEARNSDKETALFSAVEHDKIDAIQSLLELGADINAIDEDDNSALQVAAYSDRSNAVQKLLELGAQLNRRNKDGYTALHYAVFYSRKEIAKILIDQGADVDEKTNAGVSAYSFCNKLRTKGGNKTLIKIIEAASKLHDPNIKLIPLDIESGEPWSDKARLDIESLPAEPQNLWRELFSLAASCTNSKPTKTWLKKVLVVIEKLGKEHFQEKVLDWLALLSAKRTEEVDYDDCPGNWAYTSDSMLITAYNTNVLKGLIWGLINTNGPLVPGALRTVAQVMYKKVYGVGMRNAKIANAAVFTLSQIPGDDGVKEIVILRSQTKYNPALVNINRVFDRIAKERNISTTELAELAISDYGLTNIGGYKKELGHFTANLQLTSAGKSSLTWSNGEKTQKSVPAEVKREHADEVKLIKALAKDIEKASLSFRENLEQTYLNAKSWDLATWRERFINHPLGGFIGRRVIWQFVSKDKTINGIWLDDQIIGVNNKPLTLDDISEVKLWHPIDSDENEILNWRHWLIEHEIAQPIRQAFREIYILTDAERKTHDHSLRFASHILKQHQFNALAQSRRWSQTLGGSWDGGQETEASRGIPDTSYRITFYTSPFDEFALSGGGIYEYVSTGKIIIYETKDWNPVALADIPPVIFSELMRDVDLFVSVASVGNDPEWEHRHENPYWGDFSFGDLSAMAETRKQVLETIIPKLKISKQLKIEGRYLLVEGKIRSYKIHIGSGNILMEPDSAYLCIVGTRDKSSGIYIPFEGDRQLSLILSKAFLLTADNKIKDQTILSQINRQ